MTPLEITEFETFVAHYTGSDVVYRHTLSRGTYTEGVRYVVQELKAFWLLDYIFSVQFTKEVIAQKFQVWKLIKGENNEATLILEDGNSHEVARYQIEFTDFPLKQITLWLLDNVLLLPSEY